MTERAGPDAPSAADTRRMQVARSKARRALTAAEARFAEQSRDLFRAEIGATVRSVSTFLIALLATAGLLLDDVVGDVEPGYGWPRRPRIFSRRGAWTIGKHLFRHLAAGLQSHWSDIHSTHGANVDLSTHTSARIQIIEHSIGVRLRVGTVSFDTCFGLLRIELVRCLPDTLAIACVGRLVKEVVDHIALRGSGWRIADIEQPESGSTLVVETGSVAYRLPWAR